MFISIEGVIGAGKSSLTNILANEINAKPIYEVVEENPYLEKFYKEQKTYAFQVEMFFLTSRCNQIRELETKYLDVQRDIIADYSLAKSLIFAKKTLNSKEYDKFCKIYDILIEDFAKPDLIIIIKSDLDILKEHIKERNRDFERDIQDSYLLYLIDGYNQYINYLTTKYKNKLLIIDGNKYDFVNNSKHKKEVIEIIKNKMYNY